MNSSLWFFVVRCCFFQLVVEFDQDEQLAPDGLDPLLQPGERAKDHKVVIGVQGFQCVVTPRPDQSKMLAGIPPDEIFQHTGLVLLVLLACRGCCGFFRVNRLCFLTVGERFGRVYAEFAFLGGCGAVAAFLIQNRGLIAVVLQVIDLLQSSLW